MDPLFYMTNLKMGDEKIKGGDPVNELNEQLISSFLLIKFGFIFSLVIMNFISIEQMPPTNNKMNKSHVRPLIPKL